MTTIDYEKELLAPAQDEERPLPEMDEGLANWYLKKLAAAENELAVLKAQYNKMRASVTAERDRLTHSFGESFEQWSREKLTAAGRRTLHMPYGSINLRRAGGNLEIRDPEEAFATAVRLNCLQMDPVAYLEAADRALKTDGELLPGVVLTEEYDNFSITIPKPGKDRGKGDAE